MKYKIISLLVLIIFIHGCSLLKGKPEMAVESEVIEEVGEEVESEVIEELVVISTNKGIIKLELYPEAAPETVANFKKLINTEFYDGLTFHRYVSGFVIQGGCPDGTGTGGPGWSIPGEFQNVELSQKMPKHRKGVLAMARSQDPDSAGSQFYICLATASHLDGSYTSFGHVIEGIEVVDELRQDDVMETVRLEEK
jgi:peptidyl-prolyl cis-trans isomerase B (cyclophilin B)